MICVGVLGLPCPVDDFALGRVAQMIDGDGVFFFTAVEYRPRALTMKRKMALAIGPLLFGAPRRYVEFRLREFTTTEAAVHAMGRKYFDEVQIMKWQSPTTRVDAHCVILDRSREIEPDRVTCLDTVMFARALRVRRTRALAHCRLTILDVFSGPHQG